jgi:hypothetical protein
MTMSVSKYYEQFKGKLRTITTTATIKISTTTKPA